MNFPDTTGRPHTNTDLMLSQFREYIQTMHVVILPVWALHKHTSMQYSKKKLLHTFIIKQDSCVYMKPAWCMYVNWLWENISVMFCIQTDWLTIYSIISFILYLSSSVQLVLVSSYWVFVSTCIGFDHNRLSDKTASLPDLSLLQNYYLLN